IVAITAAVHASGGVGSGLAGLLVVFVAASGLSLSGKRAYLAAAVATLVILGEQGLSFLQGVAPAAGFLQAGVLGAMLLIIAIATQPMSRRIRETEALARQRGIDLENFAQLNEYIIQNLRESIVVVDGDDHIRLINQSAAEHLGADKEDTSRDIHESSPALAEILLDWRDNSSPAEVPSFIAADGTTVINAHIASMGSRSNGAVLIFLENANLLAEKVQQSKLAALGRLSASIAHEIRNPVGALSHAGQLLAESPTIGAEERRFLDIIQTNSTRVSNIVDSVLQLSRKDAVEPEMLPMGEWSHNFIHEFAATMELEDHQITIAASAENVDVRIDPMHLHQVAWNLCENAFKYAADDASELAVEISYGRFPGNRRPFLEISDQGPGISEELSSQIFEPFATGKKGGTGLGLFICRELCERNRATLSYHPGPEGGAVFRIVFADPSRWES
ncbi:MAG: sensor histidine kinase, partial [Gammaproteobacteria bacterium]